MIGKFQMRKQSHSTLIGLLFAAACSTQQPHQQRTFYEMAPTLPVTPTIIENTAATYSPEEFFILDCKSTMYRGERLAMDHFYCVKQNEPDCNLIKTEIKKEVQRFKEQGCPEDLEQDWII